MIIERVFKQNSSIKLEDILKSIFETKNEIIINNFFDNLEKIYEKEEENILCQSKN